MAESLRFTSQAIEWTDDISDAPSVVQLGFTKGFELDAGSSKKILTGFVLPDSLNRAFGNITVTAPFFISSTGGAAESVGLRIAAKYINLTTEGVDKADDEATIDDTGIAITNTLGRLHVATFTLNTSLMNESEGIALRLERLTDTFTGKIAMLARGIISIKESW